MANQLYEILYIIDASLDEATIQRLNNDIRNLLTGNGGEIRKETNWGTRRLAFEIQKKIEGLYINIEFTGPTDLPNHILQYVSTHQGILRHVVINIPKAKILQEKMDAERAQKQLDEAERERKEALSRAQAQADAQAQAEAQAQAAASIDAQLLSESIDEIEEEARMEGMAGVVRPTPETVADNPVVVETTTETPVAEEKVVQENEEEKIS